MAARKLLIMGGTGKQGGAAIKALLNASADFQILALTRNASSTSAQRLASNPKITVVEGDATSPASIFSVHKPIYGVFCMTTMEGKVTEEEQARPIIDASVASGVEHFVFTSVDRGGAGRSEQNPTNIPHFAVKHRIEEYLKEKTAGTKTGWTILRPVAFMDNMVPGFGIKAFASMWATLNRPLQLIAVHDIGLFAARAFMDPVSYKGRAISLAGDELSLDQARTVFKEAVGYDLPETWGFVGKLIKYMSNEMGTMFDWFSSEGYGADIKALRKEEPKLQDFGTWLKSSGFAKK